MLALVLLSGCEPAALPRAPAEPCACFDSDALDVYLEGWSLEALSWQERPTGTEDELSIRGYRWEQTEAGLWQSPTIGADVFRWSGSGEAACETWSQTWEAAPRHGWADDYDGEVLPLSGRAYDTCASLMWDWIDRNEVPVRRW